jgi:hypothetical protein
MMTACCQYAGGRMAFLEHLSVVNSQPELAGLMLVVPCAHAAQIATHSSAPGTST